MRRGGCVESGMGLRLTRRCVVVVEEDEGRGILQSFVLLVDV